MALLTLSNEGAPAHFFHLMEAPTMRPPNVKYCSVGPLECKFMALLKITHFWSNLLAWGYQHNFPIWGYQHIFGALVWYMSFYAIFWIIWLHWLLICMVMIWYKSMGVNARHRARADSSRLSIVK